MRAVHAAVLATTLLGFVVVFGCSDDPTLAKLAEGCSINSDCVDPLACAFGRCHTQCQQTRDCPAGLLCVSDGPNNVCELASEAHCDATTKCPFGLICTDATCRNACQTDADCIAGQQCGAGACYDVHQDLDGGALPTFDASADADATATTPDSGFAGSGPLGFVTSNFDATLATAVDGGLANAPSVTVSADCKANTCLPPPTTIHMSSGIDADLYVLQDLTVEQSAILELTSSDPSLPMTRPIIFAVAGTADIQGQINLTGQALVAGPGGFGQASPGPGFGGQSFGNGGGGGGSYCGVGGHGVGSGGPSGPSVAYGSPEIVPLVGGSAGGCSDGDTSGQGCGAGGGVIQISAKVAIFVRQFGAITAGGAGGAGGDGAGGSGGAILLEAPSITIDGALAANGGAGSGGPAAPAANPNDQPALGNTQAATGGNGSAGTAINGADATHANASDVAAGGGGAGRIRLNTATGAATITGVISPALTTTCATQGTIKTN